MAVRRAPASARRAKIDKGRMMMMTIPLLRRRFALWICPELARLPADRPDSDRNDGIDPRRIVTLVDILSAHVDRSELTLAKRADVHTRLVPRLRQGKGCTVGTYLKMMYWLDRNWPADLQWPTDVPRPAPDTTRTSTKEANDG